MITLCFPKPRLPSSVVIFVPQQEETGTRRTSHIHVPYAVIGFTKVVHILSSFNVIKIMSIEAPLYKVYLKIYNIMEALIAMCVVMQYPRKIGFLILLVAGLSFMSDDEVHSTSTVLERRKTKSAAASKVPAP
ncbi:hypothetical protein LIER_34836 [Lithospermum erythrorhizon]|uniref:Uncharacterized protein n=1 Tax=Lithospermum erythrorhizon TaxID=34254 RepID=A0AAV3S0Q4_LITER